MKTFNLFCKYTIVVIISKLVTMIIINSLTNKKLFRFIGFPVFCHNTIEYEFQFYRNNSNISYIFWHFIFNYRRKKREFEFDEKKYY
jgi:hypothetical protein